MTTMARMIALIRGINVGGTRKLPMAELRAACAEEGLGEVETYIQSGNLVLEGKTADAVERKLEALIQSRFGHDVPVVARKLAQWTGLIEANPFPDATEKEPNRVALLVSKDPLAKDVAEALAERARHDERIERCGAAIMIHYPKGQADTRLTPVLIDRLAGSPTTARNWTTVLKLRDMASA
jgi:uncharacterized protein (DUF1697 family)